ncbi:hypothetical protein HRG_006248 [Hirsutella rhossiliensis]|uniref:S-adenosyl-L-methionine-dependent methyltransferase n=1 Tax=Hirsutella rhossiliensis TaxID=111463 RepID=A0A9P8SI19_9HYPO|nr:uncharacterized protein HRG_06248 [Hirsutella rhossiliensis]KAH0963738.1 hypothetical protein HRG_06248 [Hirsutella rhossiliensis]
MRRIPPFHDRSPYSTRIQLMSWSLSARDFVLGVVVGAVVAFLLGTAVFAAVLRSTNGYSLGHWKLNVRTPLDSMWMNLGYWKAADGKPVHHFDEACLGLLTEILKTAGLLDQNTTSASRTLSILDLGFGCGDQTWALARLLRPRSSDHFRYVGLTLDESQLRTAMRKLHRELASPANVNPVLERASFHLYCANAAKPDSWTPAARGAVQGLADPDRTDRWLLALDCLYHFSPSRKPIFQYAAWKLDANVMAFDLILNEKASRRDKLLVRAVGLMMSCPLHTFLTEDQYRAQMVECGYDGGGVVIRDISDDVYAGVANYLRRQEEALSLYGVSIGGFKLAGRLFDWFNKSRVVKASIVVGRIKDKPETNNR